MTGSPTLLALWNLLLLIIIGALIWLLTWSIFGDRHWRTLRRCPRCGHDMRGTEGLRCGECGREVRHASALFRPRRRWWLAAASFVMIMSLALVLRNAWSQASWATMLPDRIAIWMLPWIDPSGAMGDAIDELGTRMVRGQLAMPDVERLMHRVLEGDDRAIPGSLAWSEKYGQLLTRWQTIGRKNHLDGISGRPSADRAEPTALARQKFVEEVDRRLERLPPVVRVAGPWRWIASEPVSLELVAERAWGPSAPTRLVVESLTLGSATPALLPPVTGPIDLHHRSPVIARIPLRFEAVEAGAYEGLLRVRIEMADEHGHWSAVGTTEAPLAITVAASLRELLGAPQAPGVDDFEGVRSDEMDAAIAELLAPGLVRWARGSRRFALRLSPAPDLQQRLDGVAIGVEAEVLEDGVVRRRLRLWWPGDGRLRFEPPQEDAEALARAREGDGRWTIRVRGDRELSLRAAIADRNGDRLRWWNGQIERPLRITDEEGDAIMRPWTVPTPSPTP